MKDISAADEETLRLSGITEAAAWSRGAELSAPSQEFASYTAESQRKH
jgi:hypothetical protein